MADDASFPYETRLNILHGPLEVIDVKVMAAECTYKWFNQTLCQVNGSVVRVGIIEGEYHWHKHDEDDEFFYVVEGALLIDLEDREQESKESREQEDRAQVSGKALNLVSRTVELTPGQGFVVPRTVMHRTRAPQRTVILMVENAGIIPTGN